MPGRRVRTFNLAIKLKKFTRKERKFAKYGFIDPKSATRHVIYINTEFSLMETVGTLYHEFSHWLFYTVFKDNSVITEDHEHIFCEAMDDDAKKNLQTTLGEQEEDE